MSVRLRWIGHASAVLDVDGVRILTDPLLRPHAHLLRRRGGAPERAHWEAPDAVLVSHLHHDHAELASLRLVPDATVLAAPANAHWLRARGVDAIGLRDVEWWTVPGSHVRIRPVPAVHGHRPMPHRPNAACGFVIATPRWRAWFAGDTEPYAAMADLPTMAEGPIDLALVPVGGWGPRLSGGHMDPTQAARVCGLVGARHAVPVHWGTLHTPVSRRLPPGWMDVGGPAFGAAAGREAPRCAVHVLQPGGVLELD
ncbi:MBL fold metallo-hydrolase [Cellulomonas edaphi]|uniref:MBL fold metallo-hydrolase n=1 Tax=Cellulomonas edaphi TaxID=3053468 RepID=A0ABT7S8Y5_9CELL|nr:MBL fold metallo-hydrolase [Cellulomons edaphi]MDM7832073.1 MBL fold metallo-hydrolase [Cellulomons edaphi]